jgi:hypothetical protein
MPIPVWKPVAFCGMVPTRRYTLFLRFPCGYACGDLETSAFGPRADVVGSGNTLCSPFLVRLRIMALTFQLERPCGNDGRTHEAPAGTVGAMKP